MHRQRSVRDRARMLRRAAPSPERRLWRLLKDLNRRGCHFRRQVPVGPYFLDFAWLSLGIAVEVDGDGHGSAEARARDAARDRFLAREGFVVVRFWNAEVTESAEGVAERLLAAVNQVRIGRGLPPVGWD